MATNTGDVVFVDMENVQPAQLMSNTGLTNSTSHTHSILTQRFDRGERQLRPRPPIFVPDNDDLRQRCIKSTQARLLAVHTELMKTDNNADDEAKLVKEAAALLSSLDTQVQNAFSMYQISDPIYTNERGLDVVHFDLSSKGNLPQRWMMLANKPASKSKSMFEKQDPDVEPDRYNQLLKFAGNGTRIGNFYLRRRKSMIERQPGVLVMDENDHEVFVAKYVRATLWKILIVLSCSALVLFWGVGIIATNTTFSTIFIKFFFWIAILWTLIPTVLLCWIVRAFGGTSRDVVQVALASVAIWLVVIQIGQTHLQTQLATRQG